MCRRLCAALLGGLLALPAFAQQPPQNVLPQPRLSGVMPMGAKAGSTVEVTVNGTDLEDPTGLLFSHPGITAELVAPPEPKPDPNKKDPPKPAPKGPVTKHKYKVTVPADAPVGTHDLRVVTKFGVSNARAFVVGTLPELVETDKPHADVPDAQKMELNSVVNGTIANTADVDYYSFPGKAKQRVLVSCRTSSIDSRCRPLVEVFAADGKRLGGNRNDKENDALADVTLPADGDFLVRVCEFAYQSGSAEHFYRLSVSTGLWIDAVFPNVVNPGKPTPVTVFGRNLPGGKKLDGFDLETLSVTITPPADAARDKLTVREVLAPPQSLQDGFEYRLPGSNAVPVFFTDAAIHIEKDAGNDKPEAAEAIPVPCDVTGTIGKRYDKDWFGFEAKKGDVLYVELLADRLGSGMDTFFVVKNAGGNMGNVVEEQDDDQDSLHPQTFFTRSGDPAAAKFTAPADGKYLVLVGSREANVNYGPRCGYRLRVSKPTPDFRAVVMPKSRDLNGASLGYAGGQLALDVFIDRRDGFKEPVTATVEGLPAGVTAQPTVVGTGQRWGTLVLTVTDGAAAFTGPIRVKCSATVNDKPVAHEARTASITWSVQPNNNTATITRLDREFVLAVRPEKAPLRVAVDLPAVKVKSKDKDGKDVEKAAEFPLFVKPGDKVVVPVKVTWQGGEARANPVNVRFEQTQPNNNQAPLNVQGGGGNNNPNMTIPKDKGDGTLTVDVRQNSAPGVYSIHLQADTQVQFLRDPNQKDKKSNAVVQAFAEPIQVTVLPNTLGKFSVTPPANNQLKAGTTAELVLKVERQADYAGEFAVKVTLPVDAKGLTVKDAVVPAGKDEVKIPVEVAKDAKDATVQATVTATATVHGKFPITHEVKVQNLRVVPEKK